MERLWNLYCGQSDCLIIDTELCTRVQFEFVTHPSSCVNHAFIIFFDILLLSGLLVNMICKINSKRVGIWTRYRSFSTLQIASVILNGCLGLLYIGLGTWILVMKLRNDHSASPIHWWVLYFFQGFTWALVGLTTSLKVEYFSRAPLRIFSIFAFLSAGMFCFLSLFAAIVNNQTTVKVTLDILSFLGATLLLLCTYKGFINEEDGEDNESTLYTLLNGKANGSCKFDSAVQVSPFAEAGLFSRLTFWWLNPLMKLGKLKTIKDEDIPKLRDVDRAEFCYLQFENQLNKQKQDEPFLQSSMLWTIVACHWNDILLSGFCAALKILTLSTGPLLLNAFIEVAEGKEAFKYKGYLLALALFLSKTLESLSQRQWYFRCRLIGLKVRSLLTATIYKKQLRLSNAVRMMHSAETLRLVQEPIRSIPDVISAVIQAKVAFTRIVEFLLEPELLTQNVKRKSRMENLDHAIKMRSANLYWETNSSKSTLRNINIVVRPGEKVAICGEVGSGKSTLLAAILGEVPYIEGTAAVYGKIAYVSQRAWIQTGTIRENILFGSSMNELRYQETLWRCSLIKDLDLLPFGDMTEIGERGVNLSGGQKQRIQLARALYQDADIYLLDDPFSAVDAHTATSLFSEYIMESLSGKTVLLVTHQIDFLPAFHCCLLMSDGEILQSGSYHELLASSPEFLDLVNAHKETAGTEKIPDGGASGRHNSSAKEIKRTIVEKQYEVSEDDQLIKREEREVGDTGLKPYLLYLNQNKGYMYLSIGIICHLIFVTGQILQNTWMASSVDNPHVSTYKLIVVYLVIGASSTLFLLFRCLAVVAMGLNASKSLFSRLMNSLFCAPMSFYDSTPLGRILSRVSSDLGIVDLDVPFSLLISIETTIIAYANLGVLAVITWQVLFVCIPMIYLAIRLQRYYFATAKELMRMNGTTKSLIANHLAESIAGATTIRAFEEEERFFAKSLDIIDMNASPFFHNFTASEWLIQRLETLSATVLAAAALCMVFLPTGTFSSGFIGMALSYGLSLNVFLVNSIQNQCTLANNIICVERLDQYMHIPSEAPKVIEDCRPPENWPSVGKVEICNLQIRYRPDTPLVLNGISCTFKGGNKIGIVGRTGSGKTTLVGALFRLVEPAAGKIIVDGINICSIGLHDLRSRFGIIPQDPTLFNGTVRFNLDPLCQHNDVKLWEVLGKCQLKEVVQDKEQGLDSAVMEDGSNWSMGQRQLFCLGRALLRRSRVLVLDEATASIDNATDMVLQRTIRSEFADCTVITVAHRIPTVMDCAKVLAISDGKLVEYDNPMELMKKEDSLFGQLVKEYWSHFQSAEQTH